MVHLEEIEVYTKNDSVIWHQNTNRCRVFAYMMCNVQNLAIQEEARMDAFWMNVIQASQLSTRSEPFTGIMSIPCLGRCHVVFEACVFSKKVMIYYDQA